MNRTYYHGKDGAKHDRAPRTHMLKTWPVFFVAVRMYYKTFEIRKNDRDFKVGDTLILEEWDPETEEYTGEKVRRQVVYITDFDQPDGQIVMGIK